MVRRGGVSVLRVEAVAEGVEVKEGLVVVVVGGAGISGVVVLAGGSGGDGGGGGVKVCVGWVVVDEVWEREVNSKVGENVGSSGGGVSARLGEMSAC